MTDREMLMELIAKVMANGVEEKINQMSEGNEQTKRDLTNEWYHLKKNGNIILRGNDLSAITFVFDENGNIKRWR